MVDQKSDNPRTLTGNHGGLRRGTAAAALGAVLVLSAGVPASNAATPAWITDAVSTDTSSADSGSADSVSTDSLNGVTLLPGAVEDDTRGGTRLSATTVSGDAADLEAWAAAALSGEQDPPAYPAPTLSTASALPEPTESPVPSLLSSTTPLAPEPLPSRPSPSTTTTPSAKPEPSTPEPSTTAPSPTAPSPAPSTAEPSATPESGATPSTSQKSVPAPSQASLPTPGQAPAAGTPAPAPATSATSDAAPVPSSQTPAAGTSATEDALAKADGAQAAGSHAYGRSASGVWGSGELSGPMNMASLGDRYAADAPYSGAVLGASDDGPVSPLVLAGAVLVILAGAAGLVAFRIRRSL